MCSFRQRKTREMTDLELFCLVQKYIKQSEENQLQHILLCDFHEEQTMTDLQFPRLFFWTLCKMGTICTFLLVLGILPLSSWPVKGESSQISQHHCIQPFMYTCRASTLSSNPWLSSYSQLIDLSLEPFHWPQVPRSPQWRRLRQRRYFMAWVSSVFSVSHLQSRYWLNSFRTLLEKRL